MDGGGPHRDVSQHARRTVGEQGAGEVFTIHVGLGASPCVLGVGQEHSEDRERIASFARGDFGKRIREPRISMLSALGKPLKGDRFLRGGAEKAGHCERASALTN